VERPSGDGEQTVVSKAVGDRRSGELPVAFSEWAIVSEATDIIDESIYCGTKEYMSKL
jgi:hypothetical protein